VQIHELRNGVVSPAARDELHFAASTPTVVVPMGAQPCPHISVADPVDGTAAADVVAAILFATGGVDIAVRCVGCGQNDAYALDTMLNSPAWKTKRYGRPSDRRDGRAGRRGRAGLAPASCRITFIDIAYYLNNTQLPPMRPALGDGHAARKAPRVIFCPVFLSRRADAHFYGYDLFYMFSDLPLGRMLGALATAPRLSRLWPRVSGPCIPAHAGTLSGRHGTLDSGRHGDRVKLYNDVFRQIFHFMFGGAPAVPKTAKAGRLLYRRLQQMLTRIASGDVDRMCVLARRGRSSQTTTTVARGRADWASCASSNGLPGSLLPTCAPSSPSSAG
jgi:hypothetical protein